MSLQSQMKNMKLLAGYLSQDLGYIFGERENGPNGAKKDFLATGRAFSLHYAGMQASPNRRSTSTRQA